VSTLASVRIGAEEGRLLASLVEKQLTTPQQYPLTANALQLACNQTSNRDPVVHYDEGTVERALHSLKAAGLVSFVHPSHGRSVIRYHQLLADRLGLSERQSALVAMLLLRGPQTAAELRARTERMGAGGAIAEVELALEELSSRPEPVVARMRRRPGQKEERWVELLTGDAGGAAAAATRVEPAPGVTAGETHSADAGADASRPGASGPAAELAGRGSEAGGEAAELRAVVEDLQEQIEALREQLEALRRDLYG
jgi:uncharacterized protein YceH (UPF0502 family)